MGEPHVVQEGQWTITRIGHFALVSPRGKSKVLAHECHGGV